MNFVLMTSVLKLVPAQLLSCPTIVLSERDWRLLIWFWTHEFTRFMIERLSVIEIKGASLFRFLIPSDSRIDKYPC